ncbi:MAG: hypothetical protein ACPHP8_08705 [Luminiphilus sp.]
MATRYPFKTATGEELIPVSDGEFFTDIIDGGSYGECYFAFYDSDGETLLGAESASNITGTIEVLSAPIEGQFMAPARWGVINAADVAVANYTPPSFPSIVVQSKAILSGVSGAAYIKGFHWRAGE